MHRRRLAAYVTAVLVAGAALVTTTRPAEAAAGCQAKYTITNQWAGGFGAAVDITNLGDPVSGWTVAFTFTSGQAVTQLWNGAVSQTGTLVQVRNAGWNAAIASGGTVSFGFNGSWTTGNLPAKAFSLNGVACTGGTTPSGPTPPPSSPAVRIMALGDSITGSPGCWRALLWQKLPAARVDFVGTLPAQGCGFPYDGENEGHGGALVTNVADQDQLPGWLAATHPDVVLMHFGTNDVWSGRPTATVLTAYGKLVSQMRTSNPAMKILVAQIIPMNPSNCAACARRVVSLNAAIPGWAAALTTAASPITVVDQWTGFDTATDTDDGVHPNGSGSAKIANRWYPALAAAIG